MGYNRQRNKYEKNEVCVKLRFSITFLFSIV